MHGGGGLLAQDAIYFDSVARELAEQINAFGWGVWSPFPAQGAALNVAILGALYALFGHDPALIIPVNAAVHALGGVLVFLVVTEMSVDEHSGVVAGIAAACLFIIFPSTLNWFAQIHKDGYAIAGTLVLLWTWLLAVNRPLDARFLFWLMLLQIPGVALIGGVRPYNLKLLVAASAGAGILILSIAVVRSEFRRMLRLVLFFVASSVMALGGVVLATALSSRGQVAEVSESNTTLSVVAQSAAGELYSNWTGGNGWHWSESPWLPNRLEYYVQTMARTRAALIDYGITSGARSLVDADIVPQSAGEVAAYFPRALEVALLAPFPTSWLKEVSITRLVAAGEMAIYYLLLPGVLFLILRGRRPSVLMALYFALFFLAVYGFTTANLGTLYRLRYGYLMVILAMGVLGWVMWMRRFKFMAKLLDSSATSQVFQSPSASAASGQPTRRHLVGKGMWVMIVTFLCFLGFFLRDILMAGVFGFGAELDDFFVALMAPMFFVTVLSIPLGAAFTPFYLDARESNLSATAAALLSKLSFLVAASLLVICVVLGLLSPMIFPLLHIQQAANMTGQFQGLIYLALPILWLSGPLILGNAVLNAHGQAVQTSVSQLIVPVVAISAVVILGRDFGVAVVMLGMVAGQILNLAVVQILLKRQGLTLLPRFAENSNIKLAPIFIQYLPLLVSALFVSLAAPVSTLLAMSLPDGSVSVLNLGNKIVLFVTGLVGAAVSSVMLPYFSSLVAKDQLVSARRELSFFILSSAFVSVPISAAMFVWADPIVRLMFIWGNLDTESVGVVVRVMQYAVVQLPFFVSNSLLLRFATATRHVTAISLTAVVGLIINVGISILLMKHMGVAGIALGSSIAMFFSTALLVSVLIGYRHIAVVDAVATMLNWLLFLTLLVSLHFKSIPGVWVTLTAYAFLLAGYIRSFHKDPGEAAGLQN